VKANFYLNLSERLLSLLHISGYSLNFNLLFNSVYLNRYYRLHATAYITQVTCHCLAYEYYMRPAKRVHIIADYLDCGNFIEGII
jgi:hypothetical protein